MKRVANLVFSKISGDGRVQRQLHHTAKEFKIDLYSRGAWEPFSENISFHPLSKSAITQLGRKLLKARLLGGRILSSFWETAYWSFEIHRDALTQLERDGPFDLIHANDMETLPVAVHAARKSGAKVLFDAHEYHPGQAKYLAGNRRWTHPPYVRYLLETYLPEVDVFVTTSPGFAELYKENFGFEPEIILNVPEMPRVAKYRAPADKIRLVHHGAAKPAREPDRFIRMMEFLDERFTLDLMLVRDGGGYYNELEKLAAELAPGRVSFHQSVSPDQIVNAISQYDIGVHTLPPIGLNHVFPLPNKLFEFMCAGLAVVIGPCPAMKDVVTQNGVGVVATDHSPQALATAISSLSRETLGQFKKNSIVASQRLNATVEMQKLVKTYSNVLMSGIPVASALNNKE